MREGIDTSHYQHPNNAGIDWKKVRQAGKSFAYVKVTEGVTIVDPWASVDSKLAHLNLLQVGGYHFARPTRSKPENQGLYYLATAKDLPFELPHALDVEDGDSLGWSSLAQWVHRCLDIGNFGMLYTNKYYFRNLKSYGAPWGRELWLATTGSVIGSPSVVQYGQGLVSGIVGNVDLNRWNESVGDGDLTSDEHATLQQTHDAVARQEAWRQWATNVIGEMYQAATGKPAPPVPS